MEYPAYSFYTEVYGGAFVSEGEWKACARKGAAFLAKLCFLCSVAPVAGDDSFQMAICAAAEEFRSFDELMAAGAVSSLSVGSVSESYDCTMGGARDMTPKGREASLMAAISPYVHVFAGVR